MKIALFYIGFILFSISPIRVIIFLPFSIIGMKLCGRIGDISLKMAAWVIIAALWQYFVSTPLPLLASLLVFGAFYLEYLSTYENLNQPARDGLLSDAWSLIFSLPITWWYFGFSLF